MNHLTNVFFGISGNQQAFTTGLQQAIAQLPPIGIYAGDNIFTFGRNLGFLEDKDFMAAVCACHPNAIETAILWRTHIACWAAHTSLKLEGDFMECGTYKGYTARVICDYLDWKTVQKTFWLYDIFAVEGQQHLSDHSDMLYTKVRERFTDLDNVRVIKGQIPESFSQGYPDKVAFLHIDMNSVEAELATLAQMFDRVVKGGLVLFDDYGWYFYRAQKEAEDAFLAERGYRAVELPTGQGLVIK